MVTKKTCIALSGMSLAFMVLACSISNVPSQSEDAVGTQVAQTLTAIALESDGKAGGQQESETPAPDPWLTLLYLQNEVLYGFDLDAMTSHVITLEVRGGVKKVAISPDERYLAYLDESGLKVIEYNSGEELLYLEYISEPREVFSPRAWSHQDLLLVDRYWGTENMELGWVSLEGKKWQALPLPEGSDIYGCYTGVAWAPMEARIAVTGLGYAHPCNRSPGLTVVNLDTGSAIRIVSQMVSSGSEDGFQIIAGGHSPKWSPDGEWIAFGLDENATAPQDFPIRIYLVRPDGSDLTPVSVNSMGTASGPVWASSEGFYFKLNGDSPERDGIYYYDLENRQRTMVFAGSNLHPVSLSPDGEILLYRTGLSTEYTAWVLEDQQTLTIPENPNDVNVYFVGWMVMD